MSVIAVFVSSSLISFFRLSQFLYRTRSFSRTLLNFREIVMSNLSIESISSCEIADSNYGLLKPKSPDLSQKSEVVCSLTFKESVPGVCFIVSGIILKTCERFSINLLSTGHKQDIALHLNPRLPQNYIVRNSKINGSWGTEETCSQFSSHYDLFRGHKFSIEILITESEFMLSINNRHFGSFAHRVPYRKVNGIEVKGDVKQVAIDQVFRERYPEVPIQNIMTQDMLNDDYKFVVPYIANISGSFTRNKSIHIIGRVKLLPHSITINLQQTPYFWPHPTIALHINPRFGGGNHIICRNTWKNGRWMKEERTDITSRDLSPGKEFELVIECDYESYHISLNGQFFADYKFRCDDYATKIVDTLNISGDVVLKEVYIETKTFD